MQFNLADIFETVADAVPDRIALTYEGQHLSYKSLNAEANKVAHFLAEAGVAPGEHVALFLKNSIEHVTSLLGILKIRAVPINVNYRYTPSESSTSSPLGLGRGGRRTSRAPAHPRRPPRQLPVVRTVIVVGEPEQGAAHRGRGTVRDGAAVQ